MRNVLSDKGEREVFTCSENRHIRSAHPTRRLGMHDLIFIRDGEWEIAQDGIPYSVRRGDAILLQAGHPHAGVRPCEGEVKTFFVHFEPFAEDRIDDEAAQREEAITFPMVVHCGEDPFVEQLFREMIQAYWSKDACAAKAASAYLSLLLCQLSKIPSGTSLLIRRICSEIRGNPDRFLSARELAGRYGCSERTLTGRFRKEMGESLHAWQIRLKCRMAEELLRSEPEITLKEIAANYGFCDEYHFGKCFKKVFGYSPKRGFGGGGRGPALPAGRRSGGEAPERDDAERENRHA